MMDWTDPHCRYFHRQLSPQARLYTEMVHANAVIHGDRSRLLAKHAAEHPVALQLGGSEPAALAQATQIGVEAGFDEINLNVGCPSDRVQAGRFGACLLREPALVADCVAAMMQVATPAPTSGTAPLAAQAGGPRAPDERPQAAAIPVTVKCRLGVDQDQDYALFLAFIDTVAAAGCAHFVVHARNAWLQGLSPKENRDVPPLRYEWVYRLKRERPELRIDINGGIASVESVLAQLAHVDGVMLGRAAYHDPYLLHRLDVRLHGGGLLERDALLRAMRPYVEERLGAGTPLKHMARHWLDLFHGQPGGRAFRRVLSEGAHLPGADWSLVETALAQTERRPLVA